jgi:hypothetical protein
LSARYGPTGLHLSARFGFALLSARYALKGSAFS